MTSSNEGFACGSNNSLPTWYVSHNALTMYEHLAQQGFPTVEQFRRGILLGCIAHALWLAANEGMFAHNHQWEGDTYYNNNDQGECWAVAFTPEGAVAVFYSNESKRNPFPKGSPPYDQGIYFRGMPDALQTAKERAISWMINLDWGTGGPNAAITAATWATGERFTANEPWEAVFSNSAWACYQQLLPLDVALIEWGREFDLNDEDVVVLRSLYQRRLGTTAARIRVEPWERQAFMRGRETCSPAEWGSDPGLSAARDALASVGITLRIEEEGQGRRPA